MEMPTLQIGLDIATALSVIVAAVTYITSERKKHDENIALKKDRDKQHRKESREKFAVTLAECITKLLSEIKAVGGRVYQIVLDAKANPSSDRQAVTAQILKETDELFDEIGLVTVPSLKVRLIAAGGDLNMMEVVDEYTRDYDKHRELTQNALYGFKKASQNPSTSLKYDWDMILDQVIPLLLAPEPIGEEFHSLHSATVKLMDCLSQFAVQDPATTD